MRSPLTIALAGALIVGCGGNHVHVGKPWTPLAGVAAMTAEFRQFIDHGRTPSRVVDFVEKRSSRFRIVDVHASTGMRARPGDRLLFVDRDRTAVFVVVGRKPLVTGGAHVLGAHIDTPSPRLAPQPVGETEQTTLKAFRYGGMRTHHWVHVPLALVGRVARASGGTVDVELGLHDDFALYIADTHKGLRVTVSSTPTTERPDGVPPQTLAALLHARYGLTPEDLQAAELYLVPKHGAREVGIDRQLIGAHGQDDRVNSYAAWRAVIDVAGTPQVTAMTWLVDREEVGSAHAVGGRSRFLELVYAWLIRAQGTRVTEAALDRALARSTALSADTPAAVNPNWAQVHELKNAPFLGHGPALFPFTGHGGKGGGSQARAGLVEAVVEAFASAHVPLQFGELGRVDEGGGGSIAKYLAHRGMDVVDIGVSVVGMHSPMELSAKADIWSAYRGFRQWLQQ